MNLLYDRLAEHGVNIGHIFTIFRVGLIFKFCFSFNPYTLHIAGILFTTRGMCGAFVALAMFTFCGEVGNGSPNNLSKVVPIVDIRNKEVILCTIVGWAHSDLAQ